VRPFGADRLEAAATRAIEIGTLTYGSVRSILDNKPDRQSPATASGSGDRTGACDGIEQGSHERSEGSPIEAPKLSSDAPVGAALRAGLPAS
jgi:hypothetical protein